MDLHRRWEYTLQSDVDSIGEARSHVRTALDGYADEDTLGRVELVVSELVTNSVVHAPGQPITLRLATDPSGDIAGEVEDRGEGVVALRPRHELPAVGGLGLNLVDHLTSAWGVYPETTRIWFRFAAAA